jgi:hypothetical protein
MWRAFIGSAARCAPPAQGGDEDGVGVAPHADGAEAGDFAA